MQHKTRTFLLFGVLVLLLGGAATAQDFVEPGRIRDPGGLQQRAVIVYNPDRDHYRMAYGGKHQNDTDPELALTSTLTVDKQYGFDEKVISTLDFIFAVDLIYNPDRGEFLYVYRGANQAVRAHFLDIDGNPTGAAGEFALGSGQDPHVAYSADSERYVVTWQATGPSVKYAVVDADSTNPSPRLLTGTVTADGAKDDIEYSPVSQQFLVTFQREIGGNRAADIFGAFLSTDGASVLDTFTIDSSGDNQNGATLEYVEKGDRFIVAYQTWQRDPPDLKVRLINAATGEVTRSFTAASNQNWEVPRAIAYNASTETVTFGWRLDGSPAQALAQEWEVSDLGAGAVGDVIPLSNLNPGVLSAAARPHETHPQVALLWRQSNGGDGIHAGVLDLTPPPPDLTAPGRITDLRGNSGDPEIVVTPSVESSSGGSGQDASVDGDFGTHWQTPKRTAIQEEQITYRFSGPTALSRVRLWAKQSGDLFPEDYTILTGPSLDALVPIVSETGATVAPGEFLEHDLGGASGEFVQILVTKTRPTGSKFRLELAEVQFFEASSTPETITVRFTAPGDDEFVGAAREYDLRVSTDGAITNDNFDDQTRILGLPPPELAGNEEEFTIAGLGVEQRVWVAVKTWDDNDNLSELSNVLEIATPGIPPAAVNDLRVFNPGGTTATADWTATGDDGDVGEPSGYDLRYAAVPIDATNFHLATPVDGSGNFDFVGTETFDIVDLPPETTLYFGIRVIDDAGLVSPVDTTPTEPTVTTLDLMAPADVADFRIAPTAGPPLDASAIAIASSSDRKTTLSFDQVTDGLPETFWSSAATGTQVPQHVTLDAGETIDWVGVRILSRNSGKFFPEAFEVWTSDEPDSDFVFVQSMSGLPDTTSTWHELSFDAVSARHLRVIFTTLRRNSDGYRADVAEIEGLKSPLTFGQVKLLWTAVGDNLFSGLVDHYELRYSYSAIDDLDDFADAELVTLPNPPEPPGVEESATVEGLTPEVVVYFGIIAHDEVSNPSNLVTVSTTVPGPPPAHVTDLSIHDETGESVEVRWTATSDDDGTEDVHSYDIRWSEEPITEQNFFDVPDSFLFAATQAQGGVETHTIPDLASETEYHVAIKAIDEVGNVSRIHENGVVSTTTDDITAPGAIVLTVGASDPTPSAAVVTPVSASSELKTNQGIANLLDDNAATFWSSAAYNTSQEEWVLFDAGEIVSLSAIHLRSRSSKKLMPKSAIVEVSINGSTYIQVHSEPSIPDTLNFWTVMDFADVGARFIRIRFPELRKASGSFKAQVGDVLFLQTAPPGSIQITFPSPGDSFDTGAPTVYEIKWAEDFGVTSFEDAESVPRVQSLPLSFGELESFETLAPSEGASIQFKARAIDEAGNEGPISDAVSFTTAVTRPAPVVDLRAERVTSKTIQLAFTMTGDDGQFGQASSIDLRVSDSAIDAGNFDDADTVPVSPPLVSAGDTQTIDVVDLDPSTEYYFAAKIQDENITGISDISNVIAATTDPPDTVPPAAIDDLRGGPPVDLTTLSITPVASSGDGKPLADLVDGQSSTYWVSVGRATEGEFITFELDGGPHLIGQVRLLSFIYGTLFPEAIQVQVSDDGSVFETVAEFHDLPTSPSTWHDLSFAPVMASFVKLNIIGVRQQNNGTFKARLSEVEIQSAAFRPGDITLSFTAPGDDGSTGQASNYVVKWDTVEITDFASAQDLPDGVSVPSPGPAGTPESITIDSDLLPQDVDIWYAIVAEDETPNASPMSNVLKAPNPAQ